MLVTASWGGADVAVEVDAECRSVAALKRCLQEELPEVDVEAVRLEVCGRPVDDEGVLGLVDGSVIDVSATQAALAAAALREEGCDVDFDGFCDAACASDVRRCRLYLEAGVVWPSGFDNPLHIAAWHGYGELCELLLESGCDKDEKAQNGDTPLHRAINNNKMQMAKLLLASGCAPDLKDCDGDTPLHCAAMHDNVQLAKLLLESGCKKDTKGNEGDTPLHCAIYNDSMQVAELLLTSGCAKDVKNDDGETPLDRCTAGTPLHSLLLSHECV